MIVGCDTCLLRRFMIINVLELVGSKISNTITKQVSENHENYNLPNIINSLEPFIEVHYIDPPY